MFSDETDPFVCSASSLAMHFVSKSNLSYIATLAL